MKTIIILSLVSFLSGCAMMSGTIDLGYQPTLYSIDSVKEASIRKISVKDIVDERNTDPQLLMHKINGYGMKTSGAYLADKPVAAMVQDALEAGLEAKGFIVTSEKENLAVNGRLLELDFDVLSGFVTSTLKAKMMVELTLKDTRQDKILWKEIVIAHGEHKSGNVFAENYIRPAFQELMDDFIRKVVNNQSFLDEVAGG